jgi:hypothetical protein
MLCRASTGLRNPGWFGHLSRNRSLQDSARASWAGFSPLKQIQLHTGSGCLAPEEHRLAGHHRVVFERQRPGRVTCPSARSDSAPDAHPEWMDPVAVRHKPCSKRPQYSVYGTAVSGGRSCTKSRDRRSCGRVGTALARGSHQLLAAPGPDLHAWPGITRQPLRWLARRCISRYPDSRLRSAGFSTYTARP